MGIEILPVYLTFSSYRFASNDTSYRLSGFTSRCVYLNLDVSILTDSGLECGKRIDFIRGSSELIRAARRIVSNLLLLTTCTPSNRLYFWRVTRRIDFILTSICA